MDLSAIGFYMHDRIGNDLKGMIIFQPGSVIVSWLIAAPNLRTAIVDHLWSDSLRRRGQLLIGLSTVDGGRSRSGLQ